MHPNRVLSLFVLIAALFLPAAGDPPPTPASAEVEAELAAAFTSRRQAAPEAKSLTFDLFTPELDAAFVSPDGQTAVLWLALRDDAGRLLATEPGLALARRLDAGWQVLLPGDPGWDETLTALPPGMLPLEQSPAPETAALDETTVSASLYGYYLPYAAGTARWLEGSISHFQYIPELGYRSCSEAYCRYAYDFTDTDHFPLVASKEGTVYASRDTCPDGSEGCTNYIVLQDTSGQTYQIYLHLANGTIPDKLTPGTYVRRGQYLGDSDDTGYSTSQHVHFMVVDSIWTGGDGYYWGRSVDVRFADVPINNGIPRNCYEVTHFPIYDGATQCLGDRSDPTHLTKDWVSGNAGAYPPAGALTRPAAGNIVATTNNPLIDVSATAEDDVRVTGVQMVAKIGGQWVAVGPKVTEPVGPGLYDWDADLCAVGPLNGPLEVALRAWDHEGNVSAALAPHTIQVDHACPPPTSQLTQVETFDSTAVRLRWDASSAGAGLGSFELQARTESGNWETAQTLVVPGSQRSTWFTGQPGVRYDFRLRALDANGQPEDWPANGAAERSVMLPATCTADASEPDDTSAQAKALTIGLSAQRNLCDAGDPDWFRVDLGKAGVYFFGAASQNGGAAVRITVYAADGTTVLASGEADGVGQDVRVFFRAAAAGRYYARVEPLEDTLFGTAAVYGIVVSEGSEIFLPLVAH